MKLGSSDAEVGTSETEESSISVVKEEEEITHGVEIFILSIAFLLHIKT